MNESDVISLRFMLFIWRFMKQKWPYTSSREWMPSLGCLWFRSIMAFLLKSLLWDPGLVIISLLIYFGPQMFVDNFQTAKEALSAATAQAAEKAASSVRGFAQKSFRLSMDIKLKAPLIIIPQSSTSHNAVVVDLGLITVGNSFSLLPAEGFSLPAVVEKIDVKLTQLKLCRYQHKGLN